VPTIGTDGVSLFWNRKFIESLSIADACFIVLHEAAHCFLGHQFRFPEELRRANHRRYNVACDLALHEYIKSYLPKQTALIKDGCFVGIGRFADYPRGKAAEHYYDLLGGQEKQQDKGSQESKQGGKSGDAQQSGEKSEQSESVQIEHSQAAKGGDEQSAQSEAQYPGAEQKPTNGGVGSDSQAPLAPGEIMPHPSLGEDAEDGEGQPRSAEEAEREWQERMESSVRSAIKECGSAPGWAKEYVALSDEPVQVDWRAELRQFVTQVSRSRYSYARPARRHHHNTSVILPARRSREAGHGALIVDTSGSMSADDLSVALRELEAIFACYPEAKITLIQCDTRMIDESVKTYTRSDFPITVPPQWMGRGGTDLRPAFEYAAKHHAEYKYVMCLTDMEWDVPGCADPGLPTIWLSTERSGHQLDSQSTPKFGRVLGPLV